MARIKNADRQPVMDQTRHRLLQAAAEEFSRAGFSGANINTISVSAGFAKGTVYNYFPSKRALLLALVDEIAIQHLDFIQEQVRPQPDPARRLQCFYQAGFDFAISNLSKARILFALINGADEEFKSYIFLAYQPLFQFVAAEILTPGMEQGFFRSMDAARTAMLLMTIYLGTASQLSDQGQPWLNPNDVAGLVLNGLHR